MWKKPLSILEDFMFNKKIEETCFFKKISEYFTEIFSETTPSKFMRYLQTLETILFFFY